MPGTPSALAVVQARTSSVRLPGKVLADVEGEPLLALLLRRLVAAREPTAVVVATSVDPADDAIAELGAALGLRVHRGSLDDVLARFVGAIGDHDGPVARITGDCPLIDPAVVDFAIALQRSSGRPWAHNCGPRSYPDGLDVEVVEASVLRAIAAEATDPVAREHVTTALYRDPERFPAAVLVREGEDLGHLRWTVDEPSDLDFVRAVVARLGERRHVAGLDEILAAVRAAPSLAEAGTRG
jgi:spore coat polysaccharide biosynthesis protein SpsF